MRRFKSVEIHASSVRVLVRIPLVVPPRASSNVLLPTMSSEEIRANAYVGFDTITQQIEHKLLKRGFQFNVIVVGTWLLTPFPLPPPHSRRIHRSDRFGKVDVDKHHLCLSFDRLKGPLGGRRASQTDD